MDLIKHLRLDWIVLKENFLCWFIDKMMLICLSRAKAMHLDSYGLKTEGCGCNVSLLKEKTNNRTWYLWSHSHECFKSMGYINEKWILKLGCRPQCNGNLILSTLLLRKCLVLFSLPFQSHAYEALGLGKISSSSLKKFSLLGRKLPFTMY